MEGFDGPHFEAFLQAVDHANAHGAGGTGEGGNEDETLTRAGTKRKGKADVSLWRSAGLAEFEAAVHQQQLGRTSDRLARARSATLVEDGLHTDYPSRAACKPHSGGCLQAPKAKLTMGSQMAPSVPATHTQFMGQTSDHARHPCQGRGMPVVPRAPMPHVPSNYLSPAISKFDYESGTDCEPGVDRRLSIDRYELRVNASSSLIAFEEAVRRAACATAAPAPADDSQGEASNQPSWLTGAQHGRRAGGGDDGYAHNPHQDDLLCGRVGVDAGCDAMSVPETKTWPMQFGLAQSLLQRPTCSLPTLPDATSCHQPELESTITPRPAPRPTFSPEVTADMSAPRAPDTSSGAAELRMPLVWYRVTKAFQHVLLACVLLALFYVRHLSYGVVNQGAGHMVVSGSDRLPSVDSSFQLHQRWPSAQLRQACSASRASMVAQALRPVAPLGTLGKAMGKSVARLWSHARVAGIPGASGRGNFRNEERKALRLPNILAARAQTLVNITVSRPWQEVA